MIDTSMRSAETISMGFCILLESTIIVISVMSFLDVAVDVVHVVRLLQSKRQSRITTNRNKVMLYEYERIEFAVCCLFK